MKNETTENTMICEKTEEASRNLGEYECRAAVTMPQKVIPEINETDETNETEANETAEIIETTETIQYYEIICYDEETEQHVATTSTTYSLKKSSGLEIMTVSPKDNEEVEQDTALTVTTTESDGVSCGYAAYGSLEYLEMTQVTESAFRANLKGLEQGYNAFTVLCEDEYGNSAERTVSFYVST